MYIKDRGVKEGEAQKQRWQRPLEEAGRVLLWGERQEMVKSGRGRWSGRGWELPGSGGERRQGGPQRGPVTQAASWRGCSLFPLGKETCFDLMPWKCYGKVRSKDGRVWGDALCMGQEEKPICCCGRKEREEAGREVKQEAAGGHSGV